MNYLTQLKPGLIALILLLLAGANVACSISEEQKHAYRNAESIKPISMPSGLELAQSRESLAIPEQTKTKLASVDELEIPPRIVDSVSLDILDDETAKAEKTASEKPVQASLKPVSVSVTRDDKGDSMLLVDGKFDQVWPLVKPALIELGFKIDDSSRGSEMYVISKELKEVRPFDEPIHPGDQEEPVKEEYQIHVKPSGEQTRITVHNKLGQLEGSGLADHLLLQMKQVMENPKPVSGNS